MYLLSSFKARLFSMVVFVGIGVLTTACAHDASTAWREVLQKCAKSDVIGTQSLFFGVSNSIGPGSVWRFADDKSIRLLFELSDAIPGDIDRAVLVRSNNVASCTGNSTSGWNLKLGLPFSTGVTPFSVDAEALLTKAEKVSVSVSGFAVDALKETPWKQAFKKLGSSSPYVQEVGQPNRVIASNTVKVTGLTATFTFGTKLSADIQAKFKGQTFLLGTDAATLHGDVTSDNTITLTADGPFYLLAAYSKLIGGAPIGLDQPGAIPSIILEPAAIPQGLTVRNDRGKP